MKAESGFKGWIRPARKAWRRWRLRLEFKHALLISFVLHAILLAVKFDVPGLGSAGSLFSKTERRVEELALSVSIAAH